MENLADEQLELLASSLKIQFANSGSRVIELGSTENITYLLLEGRLELEAADGRTGIVESGTESARRPIAQLVPRQFNVMARGPVFFLAIDSMLLRDLQNRATDSTEAMMVLSDEEITSEGDAPAENHLIDKIREDLANDRLILPSLPDVAIRIGRALEDEDIDAKRIARMIQADPAITAKIIKAANSALYIGREPVDNCASAVVRLGISTTHKLVVSFALGELFRARSQFLQQRMKTLWEHSTYVGAICFVLARLTKQFNRDAAMLAGLMHDIGVVAILSYAEEFPSIANDPEQLEHAIKTLRAPTGKMILEKWNFAEEYINAAEEAENWERDPAPEPDLTDLVIVAQLHSFVGTPKIDQVPFIGSLPCFKKLRLGEISPHLSLLILDKAESQLQRAKSLLSI